MSKTIFIHGEIKSDLPEGVYVAGGKYVTPSMIIPQIDDAIKNKLAEIEIDISSQGGSIFAGREIVGAIERAKLAGIVVKTTCLSFAYSMGAAIFSSGTKGYRKLSEFAELMYHNANGSIEGDINTIENYVSKLKEMSANLYNYVVSGNEENATEIKSCFDTEKFIGASDAIRLKLADGIIQKEKAVAYFDINNNQMEKENLDNAKGILKQMQDALAKFGINFSKEKNASTQAGETTFYYDGTLSVGTAVFTDEAMTTPTPDGVYGDYTVMDGKISAIAAEPADEQKQLAEAQAKVNELQAALDAKNAEINALNEKFSEAETKNKAEIEAINANMKKLEAVIVGEEGRHTDKDVQMSAKELEKKSFINSLKNLKNIKN